MKNSQYGVMAGLVLMLLKPALADSFQVFSIDSSQSYISTYTQKWTAYYDYSGFVLEGSPVPPAPIVWELEWDVKKFQVSGTFAASTQASTLKPEFGTVTMTQWKLDYQLPSYAAGPSSTYLPWQGDSSSARYVVATGALIDAGPCGLNDPLSILYGSGSTCSSISNPTFGGSASSTAITLSGWSGGRAPLTFSTGFHSSVLAVNPGLPPSLDESQYINNWREYHLVASTVPEPQTLTMLLVGGLVVFRTLRRRKIAGNTI